LKPKYNGMKLKLQHMFVTACLSIMTPAGVFMLHAQDASFDGATVSPEKERINYYPGGEGEPSGGASSVTNNTKSTTISRDSSSFRSSPARTTLPSESPKNVAKPAGNEDDVLSFNFLYYIIRKYKLQDIVD
jgi:hypothetical protein